MPDILSVYSDLNDDKVVTSAQLHPDRENRHPCDVLSIYLKGGPCYQLDGIMHRFKPPVAILLPEGVSDNDLQEGQVEGVCMLFKGCGMVKRIPGKKGKAVVSMLKTTVIVPQLKKLPLTDARQLAITIKTIGAIKRSDLTGQMEKIALLLQAVGRYCEIGLEPKQTGVHREAIHMRQLIEEWAFENVNMEKIYKETGLSPSYAGMLFKTAFGLSPAAYRIELRMRKARELLVSSRLNVAQVAYSVGFIDPLYFSRLFRRFFGKSPSRFIHNFVNMRNKMKRNVPLQICPKETAKTAANKRGGRG
jgi:AraC-like DNA-binding protein